MKRPLLTFIPFKSHVKALSNRPLTEEEINTHLPQKKRSPCPPWYQASVIKMNSTYLECMDLMFSVKGFVTICSLPLILIMSYVLLYIVWGAITPHGPKESLEITIFAIIVITIFLCIFMYFLACECFRYTHCPMRFNRRTRKVYWLRIDGTVMTEDWDKLYFTLGKSSYGSQRVYALRLSEGRRDMLDYLLLPLSAPKSEPMLLSQWEYVRRYMEEPDQLGHLAGQVEQVMDVADRRESFLGGFKRLLLTLSGGFFVMLIIVWPIALAWAIGRWIAMQTCTIPVWPEEVERECKIEPNDPYLRDRDHLAAPGTVPKPKFS